MTDTPISETEQSMDLTGVEAERLSNEGFFGRLAEAAEVRLGEGETRVTIGLATFMHMCKIIAGKQAVLAGRHWNHIKNVPKDQPVFLSNEDGDFDIVAWHWDESQKAWTAGDDDIERLWFDSVEHGPALWSPLPILLTKRDIDFILGIRDADDLSVPVIEA